jgi:hypothetical protein
MIKRKQLPPREVRQEVLVYARKKSNRLIFAEQYDEAGEVDLAIDVLFTSMQVDNYNQTSSQQILILRGRLTECKETARETADYWEQQMEAVRISTREKLADMEARHELEHDELQQWWSTPEARIPFSKPSPELLQLRRQQKAMALLHDFGNAKAIKRAAEARERIEGDEGTKRFEAALRITSKQMRDRNQREKDCLIQNAESIIAQLAVEKERSLAALKRTSNALELKIAGPQPVKKATVLLPNLKSRSTSTASTAPSGMITHRTRKQLAEFRNAPDSYRLDLGACDIRSIVRPSPRRGRGQVSAGSESTLG